MHEKCGKKISPRRDPILNMMSVERGRVSDSPTIERLISEYHASEGIVPRPERIYWAVNLSLRNQFPSILLVAREDDRLVAVVLATYSPSAELGRVLMVNDFYVEPNARRRGVGRLLAHKLLEEAKAMWIDRIDLEVLPMNKVAERFWQALDFRSEGRRVYSLDLEGAPSQ